MYVGPEVQLYKSLTSAADGMQWLASSPGQSTPAVQGTEEALRPKCDLGIVQKSVCLYSNRESNSNSLVVQSMGLSALLGYSSCLLHCWLSKYSLLSFRHRTSSI